MKNLAFLLCLLAVLSCGKKEKPVLSKKIAVRLKISVADPEITIPDSIAEKSIFVKKTEHGFFRVFVESGESRGKYFYSDTLNILKAENFVLEEHRFRKTKSAVMDRGEWNYLTIDSANIYTKHVNSKPYLFISAESGFQGQAVPGQSVPFWMINTENAAEHYVLGYIGLYTSLCESCIKGDFAENKELKKQPEIRKALYSFAKKSRLIYQPSKAEKNASYYKNFREKWADDNGEDNNWGAGYGGEMKEVKSTYYRENLFDISAGTETFIENDTYLIVSYFRGDVIAYDKAIKRYFPVIVESCALYCSKDIEFVNDHTIKITYEDDTSWNLDLTKIKFEK